MARHFAAAFRSTWHCPGIASLNIAQIQASHFNEELLLVHNLDILRERQVELADFDSGLDFREIYRPMADGNGFTRAVA